MNAVETGAPESRQAPAIYPASLFEQARDLTSTWMRTWPGMRAWQSGVSPARQGASREEPALSEIDPPASVDRLLHAGMGRMTMGVSPASLLLAWSDWILHLAMSPGKWERMGEKYLRKVVRYGNYAMRSAADPTVPPCIEPLPQDQRFRDAHWQQWPFNLVWQGFLLQQQWWYSATTGIGGVSRHHEQVVSFLARQLLDMVSPVNFIATNPEVQEATVREGGENLARGAQYLWEDWERAVGGKAPVGADAFQVGRDVAVTPGTVIFRNRLIELIQYAPNTKEVFAEPVLIVPAWIMKYYILDLSPNNSLVRYLVDRGHTVFMISWHNPTAMDRDLGMDDYLRLGVLDALKVVRKIVPDNCVNAVGYCLGGTLLSIAAAWLARERETALASVTLLAAQTDFSEPGELSLFIDHSQLDYLEDIMWDQGYLDTKQMAGAFQLMRSNDLIWSRMVNEYLLGRREPMTDLMAWNADATRMPFRMHSEYLRRCFLDNELFEGRYKIGDRPVVLSDIRAPMFVVATERDHVSPWRSVYQIKLATDAKLSFLLCNGGHNTGIVSEPGHKHRRYRIAQAEEDARYVDPDNWYAAAAPQAGSWWPAWADWLESQSSGRVAPLQPGHGHPDCPALGAAPGSYVFER